MSEHSGATFEAALHEEPPTGDPTTLTPRQELIWLEHRIAPSSTTNVMVGRFDVPAALDPTRFADAFQALIDETEALRTVFEADGAGVRRRVREDVCYRVPFVDLSAESQSPKSRSGAFWKGTRRRRWTRAAAPSTPRS